MEIIGWIGSLLFGICGLPQAYRCYKEGNARGMSHYFIWLWTGGEVFTFAYVLMFPVISWPLVVNYSINLISVIIMIKYKYWERNDFFNVDPKSWPPHPNLGYAKSYKVSGKSKSHRVFKVEGKNVTTS